MAATFVNLFISVWIAVCVPTTAATTPTPVSHVSLSVTPDPSFSAGFTNTLAVNCSFNLAPGADFHTIMSLILSKEDKIRDRADRLINGYSEVATITSFGHNITIHGDTNGADVTGLLSPTGDSYIALDWKNPPQQVDGKYMCIAHGMDKDGHPRVMMTNATVTEKPVTMAMLLQRIQEMGKVQEELIDQLELSNAMQSSTCSCEAARLEHARDAMMEAEVEYNCHRYFLSHKVTMNHAKASSQCRMFGGYLAEMDDKEEFDYVMNNFTKANDPDKLFVALGGTDQGHEGNWTLLESGKELPFSQWAPGEPNWGNVENCLYWSEQYGNNMVNYVCAHGTLWKRFLCEVPVPHCVRD